MDTFIFVGISDTQSRTMVDLQELPLTGYRDHAIKMLQKHPSAVAVEVWQGEKVIDTVKRDDHILGRD